MGQCLGTSRRRVRTTPSPKQQNGFVELGIGERYARPSSPTLDRGVKSSRQTVAPIDYGREEIRLKELFGALRTGLVFTATEFSVLPGISTTAKVLFSVGSNTLQQQLQEEESRESVPDQPEAENEENEENEESPPKQKPRKEDDSYELKVTLYGSSWTRGLRLQLTIWPVVGPFARRKLVFIWNENLLRVWGCRRGEMNARVLPVSFNTETEFCRCCLLLAYHSDPNLHLEELGDQEGESTHDGQVPALSTLAFEVAVPNLDAVPQFVTVPAKIHHLLYGTQLPVDITIRMWPSTYASPYGANMVMRIKSGIVFSEFIHLLREHFHLSRNHTVKLYHNYKPIQLGEQLTSKHTSIDSFVISYEEGPSSPTGSYSSGLNVETEESDATLVLSLVGYDVQNLQANLEMKLKDFDALLRKKFNLRNDSFLIILAEDDFAPQYTTYDNWKCIYPFSLPDNSFGAGLRRSFRRLSSRRQRGPGSPSPRNQRSTPRMLPGEQGNTPQTAKVMELLSTSGRHFPCNSEKFDFPIEELYESMPMYQLSLERCGIHPFAIIQVFEVTGPSIPITFRVLSDHSQNPTNLTRSQEPHRTRLANIMDINPNWSIHTFLQYVDAVISPASGVRRKRVSIKDRFMDDSEDLSTLTLGELLDLWQPAWWSVKGIKRRQLTIRDIDPAEFLLVEKY